MAKVEDKKWTEVEKVTRGWSRTLRNSGRGIVLRAHWPYVRADDANQRDRAMDAIDFLKKRKVLDLGPGSILVWR